MTNSWNPFQFSEDDRAFLQRRVGMFARVGLGLTGFFLILDLVTAATVDIGPLEVVRERGLWVETGVVLGLAIASVVVRWGRPGVIPLYAFDALVTLMVGGAFASVLWHLPRQPIPIELYVFLTVQTVLVFHAVVVPAPPIRTFIVHTVACLPLFFMVRGQALASPDLDPAVRWAPAVAIAIWTLTFAGVGAFVSWIVFGLRLRIREAQRLGQYRLEAKLGEGGMGVVYRAQHGMLRRPTAVKLLPPEKAGETTVARFEREVRNTSRLTHPNTVAIYDFGRTPDGVFYYAMELLDGLDLERVVSVDGPMPPARVVHVLRQCAGALGEAHELGLVHRDVKPANIVLCRRGGVPDVVKVVDFGLVKDLGTPQDANLSRADVITGTPLYMPPESIATPDRMDGRADLYALGAVAWFLLVGRPPFEGSSVVEICAKHLHEAPRSPSAVAEQPVPPELEEIVLRLMAKDPGDRYPDAASLADALDAVELARPWTRGDALAWWRDHEGDVPEAASLRPTAPGVLTVAADARS